MTTGLRKRALSLAVTVITAMATGVIPTSRSVSTVEAEACSTGVPAAAAHGSGAYVGAAGFDKLMTFGQWRDRKADFASDYLSSTNWTDFERPSWWLERWRKICAPLVLGVPMLQTNGTTTLTAGASGAYDSHFKALARFLVAKGYPEAELRIGWEFNGSWFPWDATKNPAAWVTYFKRIVTVMRSVPGQNFRITWNVNLGSNKSLEQFYPGDAYVDVVGVDAYDWRMGDSTITPEARWLWIRQQKYGLDWVAAFATKHGKRIAVPEWGLAPKSDMKNGGGGDDPHYVQQMLQWVKDNNVLYESYYDINKSRISNNQFPLAALQYKASLMQ